jgi:hypothetical protein
MTTILPCLAILAPCAVTAMGGCSSSSSSNNGDDAGSTSSSGASSSGSGSGSTSSSGSSGSTSSSSGSSGSSGGSGSSSGPDSGADGGSSGGSSGGGFAACSTTSLFAGVPVVDQSDEATARPSSGDGIFHDPPVQYHTLVWSGATLFTRADAQIWSIDTSVASPVEKIVTGPNVESTSVYNYSGAATCANGSFSYVTGVATMADGSLIAADLWAASVFKVANPTNAATCAVTVIAGNAGPLSNLDPSDMTTLPPYGHADGNGTSASFDTIGRIIVDDSGIIYLTDTDSNDGSIYIRKIDTTLSNKVSTLGKITSGPDEIGAFTILNGKLYAAGHSQDNKGWVIQIDTTSGTQTVVHGGDSGQWDPVADGNDPATDGLTNDGTNLIVSGAGYLWTLTPSGTLTYVAGAGQDIDNWPSGYDPTKSNPAKMAYFADGLKQDDSGKDGLSHIAYHSGAVYVTGHADGVSAFVTKVSCP